MPKLLPADDVLARMRQARAAQQNAPQGAPGAPGAPMPGGPGAANSGNGNVQHQHTFNAEFYYVVVNGNREAVKADSTYIQSLKQQYFQRETDGRLTKVVSDPSWNTAPNPNAAGGNPNPAAKQAAPTPQNKPVSQAVKNQIEAAKKASTQKKEKTAEKSKENKKTIESF